jgi:hypothetical protein
MTEIHNNPNCDGDYCREETGQVRRYPLGGGAGVFLCQACWAHENRHRYERGKETGNPQDWPQLNWFDAEILEDR